MDSTPPLQCFGSSAALITSINNNHLLSGNLCVGGQLDHAHLVQDFGFARVDVSQNAHHRCPQRVYVGVLQVFCSSFLWRSAALVIRLRTVRSNSLWEKTSAPVSPRSSAWLVHTAAPPWSTRRRPHSHCCPRHSPWPSSSWWPKLL